MTILAVDLAAKHSAACLMADDYAVLEQFDSWAYDEAGFVGKLSSYWFYTDKPVPDIMIVEDLPHGLAYTKLVKKVLRLQGRIVQALNFFVHDGEQHVVFVAPASWRSHYKGMERGTGAGAVFPVASSLGYRPPDMYQYTKGKGGRTLAAKIESDYCAAYLIAHWAVDMKKKFNTFDVVGTSRYHTDVILKKDFHAEKRDHD